MSLYRVLFALENAVILQHLQFPLLAVLFLDLFDDIIVIVFIVCGLRRVFEAMLTHSEAGFFDDEVGVILLLLDDFGGDVRVDEVVAADGGHVLSLLDELALDFRLEY